MQSDGRARIKEQGEVGATGRGKRAGHGPVNHYYTEGDMPEAHWRTYVTG